MAQINLGKIRLTETELNEKLNQRLESVKTELDEKLNQRLGTVKLGVDVNGNPGYYKYDEETGADTVIPFKSSKNGDTTGINYLKIGTIAKNLPGTLWIENDTNERLEQIDTVAILSTISSDSENSISCTDGEKYLIGDIFLNTQDTGEVGCCWIK